MIKKTAVFLLTFLALSCTFASAMFFDDNPRYIQVRNTDTTTSFIDTSSVQSGRYEPPYYLIQATVLTYDYTNNTTTGYVNNFFYDFKNQTVKAQTLATIAYDANGNAISQMVIANPEVYPCERNSINGQAADKAFFQCYNMTFFHTFN